MKGVSSLIVVVLLLAISTSLVIGFYLWGDKSTDRLKGVAEDSVEKEIGAGNAGITIPVVVNESGLSQVAIKNTGKVNLNVPGFGVFVNGILVDSIPEDNVQPTNETLVPGRTLVLNLDSSISLVKCDTIRVTGPHNTIDQYTFKEDGTC